MRYQLSHCLLFYILLSPITLVFKETAFLASCLRYKKKRRVSYFNLWEHQTRLDQRHAQVSPWHHWTLIIWETRVQLGDNKTTNSLTAGAETRVNLTKVIDTAHCNKTLYLYGNQSASSRPTRRGTFLYTSIFLSITLLSQSFVDPVPTCLNLLAGIKLRINTYSQHTVLFVLPVVLVSASPLFLLSRAERSRNVGDVGPMIDRNKHRFSEFNFVQE